MARENVSESFMSLDGFEDAIEARENQQNQSARKGGEEKREGTTSSRMRSVSEIDELKREFEKADVSGTGALKKEELRSLLTSEKSRVVTRAKSGKFNVEDLHRIAQTVDVDNTGTTSFEQLVTVLDAADKLVSTTDQEFKGESVSEDTKRSDAKAEDPVDVLEKKKKTEDEWSKAEKQFTSEALVRHHRRSSARRSLANKTEGVPKEASSDPDKTDAKEEKKEAKKEEGSANEERVLQRAPQTPDVTENCACACVVM